MLVVTGMLRCSRFCLSRFLGKECRWQLFFCGIIVCFYWLIMTLGAWLLLLGYFSLIPFIVLSVFGLITKTQSISFCSNIRILLRKTWLEDRKGKSVFILICALTIFTCVRAIIAPIHGWDALTYHLPKSVWWIKSGHMLLPEIPGGWEFHKFEFGAIELLHALVIMPFKTPLLVNLPDVVAYLLCALVSMIIIDRLAINFKACRLALALLLVLSSPTLKLLVGSCYVELHAVLLVLCGFLFLGEFLITSNVCLLYVTSAAIGCLVASKILFVPLALVYCISLLLLILRKQIGLNPIIVAYGILALPVVPWAINNFLLTGNPIAPFPVRLFGFTLFEGHPALSHLIALATKIDLNFSAELAAWAKVVFELGIASFIGFLFYLGSSLSIWWLSAGVISVLICGVFYSSEMSIVRLVWSQSRLVAPGIFPAVLVGVCSSRIMQGFFLWVLVLFALTQNIVATISGVAPFEYLVVFGGICILGFGILISGNKLHYFSNCGRYLVGFIFVLYASWIQHNFFTDYLNESSVYHADQRYWAKAVKHIYTNGPYTIAIATGLESRGDNQKLYPFFGELLQNTVIHIPASDSGAPIYPSKENVQVPLNVMKWKERLKAAGVTHVMSYYPLSFELSLLEQNGEFFKRLEGGDGWGFYAVINP